MLQEVGSALVGVLQFQSQRFSAGKCPSPNASLLVVERTLSFKPTMDRLRHENILHICLQLLIALCNMQMKTTIIMLTQKQS